MFAGEINHTLRLKVQDNQALVEFENRSDKTVKLRKVEVLGVLDLRSMGYYKVGYQRMVTMTESSGNFLMHHYQQIAKGKPKNECGLDLKCLLTEVHLGILHSKVKVRVGNPGKIHTHGWLRMTPDGSNLMLRFCLKK